MKTIILLSILSFNSLSLFAQSPSEILDCFFDALNSKNHEQLQSLCVDDLQLHSLKIDKEPQLSTQSLSDFLKGVQSIPEETKIFEKIKSKESIVTEHLAQFTLSYSFYVNDKLSHSGTNVITLAKTVNGWKITYIADTRR